MSTGAGVVHLHVLAYNFKRVLSLLGNSTLMAAMRA